MTQNHSHHQMGENRGKPHKMHKFKFKGSAINNIQGPYIQRLNTYFCYLTDDCLRNINWPNEDAIHSTHKYHAVKAMAKQ